MSDSIACPSYHRLRRSASLAACVLLTSCVTKQLEPDFAAFSKSYADDMNWQMLLNLARLDQGHPAYFMAIGEIRIGRTQAGTLQGSGTSSQTVASAVSRTVTNALSGTLTPTVSNSVNPSFIFIPINSEESARQLLTPISVDVFNTLYQQGWPVDQLLRILVERIEIRYDNVPPVVLTNSLIRGSPKSFAEFLRACEVIRELQKVGGLSLEAKNEFSALNQVEIPAMTVREPAVSVAGHEGPAIGPAKEQPTVGAKELMDAADRSRTWHQVKNGGWQLGTVRLVYRFRSDDQALTNIQHSLEKGSVIYPTDQLARFHDVLNSAVVGQSDTVEVKSDEPPAGPDTEGRPRVRTMLILRSFRNVLEAVAYEQRAYAELEKTDPRFIQSNIPEAQRRPVLRTDWSGAPGALGRPVVSLAYAGRTYQIADPPGNAMSLESRWNRDVFRLLIALSSQVTVDITKFQHQVLELSQ
jgi:hypothetical protein